MERETDAERAAILREEQQHLFAARRKIVQEIQQTIPGHLVRKQFDHRKDVLEMWGWVTIQDLPLIYRVRRAFPRNRKISFLDEIGLVTSNWTTDKPYYPAEFTPSYGTDGAGGGDFLYSANGLIPDKGRIAAAQNNGNLLQLCHEGLTKSREAYANFFSVYDTDINTRAALGAAVCICSDWMEAYIP